MKLENNTKYCQNIMKYYTKIINITSARDRIEDKNEF